MTVSLFTHMRMCVGEMDGHREIKKVILPIDGGRRRHPAN